MGEHSMSDITAQLNETVRGRIITASHADYDDARAVYQSWKTKDDKTPY